MPLHHDADVSIWPRPNWGSAALRMAEKLLWTCFMKINSFFRGVLLSTAVVFGGCGAEAVSAEGADSGLLAVYRQQSCHVGSCGAGELCLQHSGGAVLADGTTNTFYCVTIPSQCVATPTCECVAQPLGICQNCAAPADAVGTNLVVTGDLLCVGR